MEDKNEWFITRYKDGRFIDKSPYPLSRKEAKSLMGFAEIEDDGFEYKMESNLIQQGVG